MLIDLYERPNTPEAPESRALIDKIFSLSGPDGGVVGGEDGITTQRPLRDGGREAWDMMRRLREKAWQKAGLDPDMLWADQERGPSGTSESSNSGMTPSTKKLVARPWQDYTGAPKPSFADRYYALIKETHDENQVKANPEPANLGRPALDSRPRPPKTPVEQQHVGRQQMQSPIVVDQQHQQRGQHQHQQQPMQQDTNQQMWPQPAQPTITQQIPFMMPPDPTFNPGLDPTTATPLTANNNPHGGFSQCIPPPDPNLGFGPSPGPAGEQFLNPSSMIDFDWDQWDAVFGQPVPVVDEAMDLDPSGPPLVGGSGGSGGGAGNWADFG